MFCKPILEQNNGINKLKDTNQLNFEKNNKGKTKVVMEGKLGITQILATFVFNISF